MRNVFYEEHKGCIISANVYGITLHYCVIDDLSHKKLISGTVNAEVANIVYLRNKLRAFAESRNSNFELNVLELYR